MKRIIICCDGTWNSPDKTENGVPIHTNVVKVAKAIARKDKKGKRQLMYYDPGVGTSGSWLKRLYDGATGSGLTRNIREAYSFLIRNYEVGDELFFFGFSRGAYTVRSLSGLIRNCGILKDDNIELIKKALGVYRSRSKATHPNTNESILFRTTYALSDITPIKFIGVWDTVGSLGNPLLLGALRRKDRFHDTDLSSKVENAFHALAIDEKRAHFKPAIWYQKEPVKGQKLEQTWFVGVHSNVGGGYPSTGLSDIALKWMSNKATSCGLHLEKVELGVEATKVPEESWSGFYKLIPRYFRPIDERDRERGETFESVHPSAATFYQTEQSYRPGNLVKYFFRFPIR